jgi:DNA ligase (NAD+)
MCRWKKIVEVKQDAIIKIKGFGDTTSGRIVNSIAGMAETIRHMLDLGFNLQRTPLASEQAVVDSPIAEKGIVFTGKMNHGSRQRMQAHARMLGARVQTAVSGSTDYLVCGENVGAAKIAKAQQLGVAILSESQYIAMVDNP